MHNISVSKLYLDHLVLSTHANFRKDNIWGGNFVIWTCFISKGLERALFPKHWFILFCTVGKLEGSEEKVWETRTVAFPPKKSALCSVMDSEFCMWKLKTWSNLPKGSHWLALGKNLPACAVTHRLCWQKSGSADCFVSVMLANNKATSAVDMARENPFSQSTKWPGREAGRHWESWVLLLLIFLCKIYGKMNLHSLRVTGGTSEPLHYSCAKPLSALLL